MSGQALMQALAAGLATLFLIGLILAIKAVGKGVNKAREMTQLVRDELVKVDLLVEKLDYISVIPNTGKAEYIHFYLNQEDEKLFYDIPPEYLKRLRPKLEKLINQLEQNDITYGHQYAEREFYIGSKLMFSWHREMKI
ncbi:hypothetical protein [Ursidibacter sp. B-7004-1]